MYLVPTVTNQYLHMLHLSTAMLIHHRDIVWLSVSYHSAESLLNVIVGGKVLLATNYNYTRHGIL